MSGIHSFLAGLDVGLLVGILALGSFQLRMRNHAIAEAQRQLDGLLSDEWHDGSQAFDLQIGKWCRPSRVRRALQESGAPFTEEKRSGTSWFVGSLTREQLQRFRDSWAGRNGGMLT